MLNDVGSTLQIARRVSRDHRELPAEQLRACLERQESRDLLDLARAGAAIPVPVRRIHLGSPFENQLVLSGIGGTGLGIVLFGLKRLWGFPYEAMAHRQEQRARYLIAKRIADELETNPTALDAIFTVKGLTESTWQLTEAELDEDE